MSEAICPECSSPGICGHIYENNDGQLLPEFSFKCSNCDFTHEVKLTLPDSQRTCPFCHAGNI